MPRNGGLQSGPAEHGLYASVHEDAAALDAAVNALGCPPGGVQSRSHGGDEAHFSGAERTTGMPCWPSAQPFPAVWFCPTSPAGHCPVQSGLRSQFVDFLEITMGRLTTLVSPFRVSSCRSGQFASCTNRRASAFAGTNRCRWREAAFWVRWGLLPSSPASTDGRRGGVRGAGFLRNVIGCGGRCAGRCRLHQSSHLRWRPV